MGRGFACRQLKPFGVEIYFDLSAPMDGEHVDDLLELFRGEKLVLFRNQAIAEADQLRVIGYFGRVLPPEVDYREVSVDGELGTSALAFHSDVMFSVEPFRMISLYGMEIEGRTSTCFASGTRIVDLLPGSLRERLEGLRATNVMSLTTAFRDLPFETDRSMPYLTQPTFVEHPRTGEAVLYVSQKQTSRFEDMSQEESDALLGEVFRQIYGPENVYEHVWSVGDLVIWDNFAVQHGRADQSGVARRRLRRVVGAEKSFFELFPQFTMDSPRMVAMDLPSPDGDLSG